MTPSIQAFLRDDDGATAIEYGLLVAIVSVVIIVSLIAFANSVNSTFNNVSGHL